jgi:hypothetical protein
MVPQKVRICLYESAHQSRVAWWIEAESKRHRVENGRYLLIDGRWRSHVGDRLHHYLRYKANAQQALRECAGVICPLGVGMLRRNNIRRCRRCEDNARHVPHWGVGVVDSLDSQRGAASCLAMVAPPPLPAERKTAGQTRMLLFRHGGKTSSSSLPPGELTTVVVAFAQRGEEYHVIAAVEGHELDTPEMEQRPGLKRLLETTHLELNGKLFVNTQQAPTWRANCRRFDPGGSLDRRVNLSLRVLAQMGWRETEHKRGKHGSCYSALGGCARSRGYKRSRGRESEHVRQPVLPRHPPLHEGPGPSFYRCKERVQVYNRGVAMH